VIESGIGKRNKKQLLSRFIKNIIIFIAISSICFSWISCASQKEKDTSSDDKTPSKPDVQIEFVLGETQVIVQEKISKSKSSEIEIISQDESEKITDVIQEYYKTAFLDPDRWDSGKFNDLSSFFTEDIRDRVNGDDFKKLCFAEDANKIDYLETLDASIPTIWLDIDENLLPQLCVVNTEVEARFSQNDGNTAYFTSTGTFYMIPVDNNWQIMDYDTAYKLETEGISD